MADIFEKKHVCIIGIGSNIDPEENIAKVLAILRKETDLISESQFIRTMPVGIENQPDFLNGAVKVLTGEEMNVFNFYLKSLEDRLHRDRSAPKYGPRVIDLDLVAWDGEILDPDYYKRDYLKKVVDEVM
jgi:2-amino-4-hydroxy-6-hydroxymethyldihydropteridine diphosphokinase